MLWLIDTKKVPTMKAFILPFILLLTISGCSTTGMTSQEKTTAYIDFIETEQLESIDKIRSFRFSGWQSLNNRYLIITASPRRKYLINIGSHCSDIKFSQAIIVNQSTSTSLSVRFDSISLLDTPQIKCFIKSIYPITKEQSKALSNIGKPLEKESQKSKEEK